MAKKKQKSKKATKTTSTSKKTTFERHSDWHSEKKLPAAKPDPEEKTDLDILGEDDDIDEKFSEFSESVKSPLKKYPSPKKNETFKKMWRSYIIILAARKNFKDIYLYQLEILCDLHVRYEELSKFIRTRGYSYEAYGRQGKAVKLYPEVSQLNRVEAEIRNYSKILGLMLTVDKEETDPNAGSDWE